MELTHLHLMMTHLPISGTIIGAIILIYGRYTGSYHTKMAAYIILLLAVVGCIIAFSTGEAAEETAEHLPGVAKSLIEEHEEFAKITLPVSIALGLSALMGLYLTRIRSRFAKVTSLIVLILSLICFGLASWTGYLGGRIRHTEISSMPLPAAHTYGQISHYS